MQRPATSWPNCASVYTNVNVDDKLQRVEHRVAAGHRTRLPARSGAGDGPLGAEAARVARRAPAPRRLRARATTSTSSSTRWPIMSRGPPRIDYGPVRITKSQPGTRAYGAAGEKADARKGPRPPMAELQHDRNRGAALPAGAGEEPHWQVLHRAVHRRHVGAAGLQYIKDDLDGSLSFRWSCRMAICGSCGMMINGMPKLSCQTFLRDYYPGRVRVEALAHFPIERDLVINMDGFMTKLDKHPALHHPQGSAHAGAGRVPADAGATQRQYEQFSSASTACCVTPPARSSASTRLHRPGGLALLHRYNIDSRDGGQALRMEHQFRRGRVQLHRGGLLLRGLPEGRGPGQCGQPEQDRQREGLLPALPAPKGRTSPVSKPVVPTALFADGSGWWHRRTPTSSST
jgi:fumarate reductase iron-sulfur subunit